MSADKIIHVTDASVSVSEKDCPVCCSTYTTTVRRPVTCASCAYAACTTCVKGFLLSTAAEPHCMNCRHVWNREFLDSHLTRSWREGELKRHRETVLFDREKSLLPTSQEAIISRHKSDTAEKVVKEAKAELKAMHLRKVELNGIIYRNEFFLKNGVWPGAAGASHAAAIPEKRKFIAACPDPDCRGFLSTAYKCGVCAKQYCSKCREIDADEHTCDPELVATIKAIVADSRPCPNCGMAISRVSGCDQMFCTECNTAFSYSTGKVVTGVIHNPHYFERLAKLKATGATAVAGAGICEANGWPPYYTCFTGHPIIRYIDPITTRMIGNFYQLGIHLQEVELPTLPRPDVPIDNTDLRVQYLLKEIDEKQLRQKLQQRERKRERDLEFRGPLELAVITILEFFVWLVQPENRVLANRHDLAAEIEKRATTLHTFIHDYINNSLRGIGDRYANIAPQIILGDRRRSLDWSGYKPAKVKKAAAKASPPESD